MEPHGTIAFSTVGVQFYGFDVFSVHLPVPVTSDTNLTERRLTDGISGNFNAQFLDEGDTVTFVSERTGSSRLYQTGPNHPTPIPTSLTSLFHDRPTIRNGRLIFVSAHEEPDRRFRSWAAVYSKDLKTGETVRLSPTGVADFSPSVSPSGNKIAVASYGSWRWKGDFRELDTEIAVFEVAAPEDRHVIVRTGGWPSWDGENAVFYHKKADDGWWSIFRYDMTDKSDTRVTPPGAHVFTPAASRDEDFIAVATRRKQTKYRHVELFDLRSGKFIEITNRINPNFHHYNPFLSPESGHLGYHRSRGESDCGELTVPHFEAVSSPVEGLRMLRFPMTFPSFSPTGGHVAVNGDFLSSAGLMIVRSDGRKRWTLLEAPSAFMTAWSPTEPGVIFTSIGPIFESSKATVQIARITFDPSDLDEKRDLVTAQVSVLTKSDTFNNAFPSVSPDGKFIVFRSGRSGHKNLYIVDSATGSSIQRLTEGEWTDTMPSWSPDGEHIAFSSNRHDPENQTGFSIYMVKPDGSDLRRIRIEGLEDDEVGLERINHVCFSPDSKWLLFTANFGGIVAEPISLPNHFQPYGDLYVCRLNGTGLRRLTCNAYENGTPSWTRADGDFGAISLGEGAGERLIGQYEEPLWLTCDV